MTRHDTSIDPAIGGVTVETPKVKNAPQGGEGVI
jgi:hypothetical protein